MANGTGKVRKGQPGYVPGRDVLGRGAWLVDPNDPNRAAKSDQAAHGIHSMADHSFHRARVAEEMRAYVDVKGAAGTAAIVAERLNTLPADPREAVEVAYSAGAAYGAAVVRYFDNKESFSPMENAKSIQEDVHWKAQGDASYAPLGEIATTELADPAQDAAFVKGMLDADPRAPRLLGKDARLRVVRCVQNDPELAKLSEDVCANMWETDLKKWTLFSKAKRFEDLTPLGKERAQLFYQSLAADSIFLMKLDEFKGASDLSFGERRSISKVRKLMKESKRLSQPGSRERELHDEASYLAESSRNSKNWSDNAFNDGQMWVSRVHGRASSERRGLADRTLLRASDAGDERREKKKRVDDKIANTPAPWWIKNPELLQRP